MRLNRLRRATDGRRARRRLSLAVIAGTLMALLLGSLPALTQTCPGDCSGDGVVTVDEILKCVNDPACGGFSELQIVARRPTS